MAAVLAWAGGGCGSRTAPLIDDPPPADAGEPPPGPRVDVSAGSTHACALDLDGAVFCWGDNRVGQIGVSDVAFGSYGRPPVRPELALPDTGAIHCGARLCCALSEAGEARCWGLRPPHAPEVYRAEGSIQTVGVSEGSLCLLDEAGTVLCHGALGGPPPDFEVLVRIESGADDLSGGYRSSCAIIDGSVLCFGWNEAGELGRPTGSTDPADVYAIEGLGGVTSVAPGSRHACALTDAGEVLCWGDNARRQLGVPGPGGPSLVRVAALPSDIVRIESGHLNSCAVRATGELYCWGDNDFGQLGAAAESPSGPTSIELSRPVTDLSVGELFICAVDTANQVWCWGRNHRGQLGDGTTVRRDTPVRVALGGER